MKENVLGQSPYSYSRHLRRQIVLCVLVCLSAVVLHIVMVFARTADNHNILLLLNILTDYLAAGFLVYYISLRVLPRYRLYRLMLYPAEMLEATVTVVSDYTVRYMGVDCIRVTLTDRTVFLPQGSLTLQSDRRYTMKLVSNMIMEVGQ